MKKHITKLTALVMAVLMMMTLIPSAALSDFNLPELFSVFGGTSSPATEQADNNGDGTPDESVETAIPTEDGTPVSKAGGEGVYMAEDGTLYMDTDNDGTAEAIVGDTVSETDAPFNVQQGKVTNTEVYNATALNNGTTGVDSVGMVPKTLSAYEPTDTNNEDHPFLPGGAAWMDLSKIYYGAPATQNYPLTKWSANTSVYNVTEYGTYSSGKAGTIKEKMFAFRDLDLIDGYTFADYANDPLLPSIRGSIDSKQSKYNMPFLTQKNGNTAYAYNRYDAMQGKYGITFDRNVKSAVWYPSWAKDYFPDAAESDGFADLYNSVVYLSDTPYLYFSTEALDTTKIAISLLIGAPVQREKKVTYEPNNDTQTFSTNEDMYEYRWYTITDNADRPGISAGSMDNSMIPIVTISDVVFTVSANGSNAYYQQTDAVGNTLASSGKTDPIAIATAKGIAKDSLYVNGSITGCIDFTNLLPALMSDDENQDKVDKGREDIQYKVAQIRVDTETAQNGTNSAFRMNYLYFGPALSTSFAPQNLVGQNEDAESFLYKQTSTGTNGIDDASVGDKWSSESDERAYTNGWENGEAVSIVNTPNNPQKITVDTYGKGDGKLVAWSTIKNKEALQGSPDSMVWTFTDKNGKKQYMEAERAGDSGTSSDYYVMVTVPVRKWINVLGESRKISLTATLIQNGVDKNGATSKHKPAFVLWGNEDGSLGCGHNGVKFGTRFRNEDLIMVLAHKGDNYHVDYGNTYIAAEVDRTVGDGLFWNAPGETKESWFDVLRSPYTYDETVKAANSGNGHGDELVGYTFITALRFAMPIGSAVSIQNMKGDGNSAGLNSYSTTGHIVDAYDGGTGEHPIVDVEGGPLPELSMTYNSTNKTYSGTTLDSNGIKGHITSGAAAYGPMLKESYYTIYDLLDTEFITKSSRDSHYSSENGRENQIVYGQQWKNNNSGDNGYVPIYSGIGLTTNDIGQLYGAIYPGAEFTAYARIDIKPDGNQYADASWLMVGVLTKGGTPEIGWVPVSLGGTSLGLKTAGRSNDSSGKAMDAGNLVAWETIKKTGTETINGVKYTVFQFRADTNNGFSGQSKVMPGATKFSNYNYTRGVSSFLKNNWALGNLQGQMASYRVNDNGTLVSMDYGTEGSNKYPYAVDIANPAKSEAYEGPTLKYANMWSNGIGATSSSQNLKDTYLRSVNGTDLEFGMKRKHNTTNNWSVGITRVLDTPVVLQQGDIHKCYPTMYVDYDVTKGVNNSFIIGLSVQVGSEMKLYHLYGKDSLTTAHHGASRGENFGYYSLEKILTDNPGKTIKVIGVALYMWTNSTSDTEINARIRRLEIWQEETDWLDDIVKGTWTDSEKNLGAGGIKVEDSMNIINDAFFNHHSEADDGQWNITATTTQDNSSVAHDNSLTNGINYTNKGYLFQYADNTNANSYRKTNSNKGWKAYLRTDSNKDGVMNDQDDTLYSYDGYTVDGAYEYVPSVGNLRVWGPANTQISVVFEADRSFNTKNYRYLYYSYSMRDTDTGIAAEEPDTARSDGKKPGISVAIKQNQLGSGNAYSEIMMDDGTRTWAYYDSNNAYWVDKDRDNRTFKTTINAAADLSTFDGIEAVNQFVFYLNNPMNKSAEFYINYIHLSNVPPTDLIKNKLKEQEVQYYYMMDNTGDRYSARFPTIDNPTGAVSGLNCDNDRNNPIIVDRGARLSDGKFFNGDHLYGYGGTSSTSRVFNENSGSEGYYEKTYGHNSDPNADSNGSFRNIWFYDGGSATDTDYTDIKDMYKFKERNNDGSADIYDMLWSYGRWYLGAGESGLNNMFIGQKDDPSNNETANAVSGNLVRRYATENYVLLRSGIEPRKYETYYDSSGGQFIYDNSNVTLKDGIQLDENSYYITNTVLFSQYTHPLFNSELSEPVKYGFTFEGWFTIDDIDSNQSGTEDHMYKYLRKQKPGLNYFYAKWKKDTTMKDRENIATFYDVSGNVWFKQTANYANEFKLTMPDVTQVQVGNATQYIRGWRIKGQTDGILYSPGQKIVLQDSVSLVPVVSDSSGNSDLSLTVTLHNAMLYAVTGLDANGKYTTTVDLYAEAVTNKKPYHGIKATKSSNTYTYTNIPRDTIVVAMPINATNNYAWQITKEMSGATKNIATEHISGVDYLNSTKCTIASTNKSYYQFTAYQDIELTYASLTNIANYKDTKGAISTMLSSNSTVAENGTREMMFVSSFDLSAVNNAKAVAWGTLYVTNMNYSKLTDPKTQMQLDASSITQKNIEGTVVDGQVVGAGAFKTAHGAVRQVMATSKNHSNQYYLRITDIKSTTKAWAFARSYVIYQIGTSSTYYVAYSNVVRKEVLDAVAAPSEV